MARSVTDEAGCGSPAPGGTLAGRRAERRGLILDAARQLLGDQGWHGVGIDEIGTASGVTGPAVYRYFASKEALLTEALTHAAEELWSSAPPAADAPLEAWVDSHVGFVLANVDLVELWYSESRHLASEARDAQRRLQRRYLDGWTRALRARRADLDVEDAEIMVRATVGLIHAVAHADTRPRPEQSGPLLARMALAALDT